jgi:hypothetical protein
LIHLNVGLKSYIKRGIRPTEKRARASYYGTRLQSIVTGRSTSELHLIDAWWIISMSVPTKRKAPRSRRSTLSCATTSAAFDPVLDVIDRPPSLCAQAGYIKPAMRDGLIEHQIDIREHGGDLPALMDWRRPSGDRPSRSACQTS